MIYSRDTPFWSDTLGHSHVVVPEDRVCGHQELSLDDGLLRMIWSFTLTVKCATNEVVWSLTCSNARRQGMWPPGTVAG